MPGVKQLSRGAQRAIARVADANAPAVNRRFAAQWQSLRTLPDDIRPRIFLPVWIVCGVACAVLMSFAESGNQALYSRLERHGVVVSATVTSTELSNHGIVHYRFAADGRTHFAADSPDSPNPPVEHIKPGDRLHVVYDARDPKSSCACDPRELAKASTWWRTLIGGLFLASIIALLIAASIKRALDRTHGRGPGPVSAPG